MSAQKILVVAGEASGDLHGGNLVTALKKNYPALEFEGVGGSKMQAAGVKTQFNIDRMGGMGLFEFFSTLWHHIKIFRTLVKELKKQKYIGAILVNYPAFNLRLAKYCKKYNCPVFYFISPQIWASRMSRIHTIHETGKKMYVILPFEEKIYKETGMDVEFLGHPFVDIVKPSVSREEAIRDFKLNPEEPIIGLFPGSRMSEINYLLKDILGAALRIKEQLPNSQFLLPVADSIDVNVIRKRLGKNPLNISLLSGRNYDVMNCSDFLIMASGSATLEAGMLGCPMVIIYRVHPITYRIGRMMTDITRFGLINIVAEEDVVPELLNEQVNPENIFQEAKKILLDPEKSKSVRSRLLEVRSSLGQPGVLDRIANSIITALNLPNRTSNEKISL